MDFLTLDELKEPDERALVFGPLGGFDPSADRAAAALEHRQRTISGTDLIRAVPEPVRHNFDRLRLAYVYGVLCYELFTVVEQAVFFLLEHALGERLIEHYNGVLPLEDMQKEELKPLTVGNFRDVHKALREKDGSHKKGRWGLRTPDGELHQFTGSLTNLLAWARRQALLHGQRGRRSESFLVDERNYAAHPAWHEVHSPGDAAEAIRDVGEVINRLWGSRTPGGRLYPVAIKRDPIAIGWKEAGGEWAVTLAHNLPTYGEDGWSYVPVRGVFHDDDLTRFATDWELTTFPTEWLWGPGSHRDAISWLEGERPRPDSVDYLDRKLFLRVRGKEVDLPRRAGVAAAMTGDSDDEEWHLVCADFPMVAYGHVHAAVSGSEECAGDGPCDRCQAETVSKGKLGEVLGYFEERYGKVAPETLQDVAVRGPRSPLGFE